MLDSQLLEENKQAKESLISALKDLVESLKAHVDVLQKTIAFRDIDIKYINKERAALVAENVLLQRVVRAAERCNHSGVEGQVEELLKAIEEWGEFDAKTQNS